MEIRGIRWWAVCAATLATAWTTAWPAFAVPYQSKDRINVLIGYEPGGGYDVYGRFVARFLGKFLSGNPQVVPQNMPGAGSLHAANHIFNVAPKDGTVIGTVSQSLPLMQLLGQPGILFDADRFVWLGRMSDVDTVLGVWHTAPVNTIEDTKSKEIAVATGGALSGSELYVVFLNKLVGTRIKSVRGYSARESQLALERGEIDGSFSLLFGQIAVQKSNWLSEGKIRMLVQIGLQRRSTMPNVPTLIELADNENDRGILTLISAGDILGRAFLAPPDTDKDRSDQLRRAFDQLVRDPEVLEAAERSKLELNYLSGAETQALVRRYKELPSDVAATLKQTIAEAEGRNR